MKSLLPAESGSNESLLTRLEKSRLGFTLLRLQLSSLGEAYLFVGICLSLLISLMLFEIFFLHSALRVWVLVATSYMVYFLSQPLWIRRSPLYRFFLPEAKYNQVRDIWISHAENTGLIEGSITGTLLCDLRTSTDPDQYLDSSLRFLEATQNLGISTDRASLAAWTHLAKGNLSEAEAFAEVALRSLPHQLRNPFIAGRSELILLLTQELRGESPKIPPRLTQSSTHLFGLIPDSILCGGLAWIYRNRNLLETSQKWLQRHSNAKKIFPLLDLAKRNSLKTGSLPAKSSDTPTSSPKPQKQTEDHASLEVYAPADGSAVHPGFQNLARGIHVWICAVAVGGLLNSGSFATTQVPLAILINAALFPLLWNMYAGVPLWRNLFRTVSRKQDHDELGIEGKNMIHGSILLLNFVTVWEILRFLFSWTKDAQPVSVAHVFVVIGCLVALAAFYMLALVRRCPQIELAPPEKDSVMLPDQTE